MNIGQARNTLADGTEDAKDAMALLGGAAAKLREARVKVNGVLNKGYRLPSISDAGVAFDVAIEAVESARRAAVIAQRAVGEATDVIWPTV